jgi:hypothetical protein
LLAGFYRLVCAGLLLAAMPWARAQTLYDAGLGTLPEAQGRSHGAIGIATEMITGNSVLPNTSATTNTEAGWSDLPAADLNRTNRFTLLITARLDSETHFSTNRAGFPNPYGTPIIFSLEMTRVPPVPR